MTARSRAFDAIAYALLLIGVAGFLACWELARSAEDQILGRAELRKPSMKRSAPVEMKGVTWYVEPALAGRIHLAGDLIGAFWITAAAGAALKERKRLSAWAGSRIIGR